MLLWRVINGEVFWRRNTRSSRGSLTGRQFLAEERAQSGIWYQFCSFADEIGGEVGGGEVGVESEFEN